MKMRAFQACSQVHNFAKKRLHFTYWSIQFSIFNMSIQKISTKYLSKKYISNLVYNNIVHLLISSYKLIICEVTTREKFILLNLSKKYEFRVPLSKVNEEYVFNFFNRILDENISFPHLSFCVLSYSTYLRLCFVYLIND